MSHLRHYYILNLERKISSLPPYQPWPISKFMKDFKRGSLLKKELSFLTYKVESFWSGIYRVRVRSIYFIYITLDSILISMVWIKCIHESYMEIDFAELGSPAPTLKASKGEGKPTSLRQTHQHPNLRGYVKLLYLPYQYSVFIGLFLENIVNFFFFYNSFHFPPQ